MTPADQLAALTVLVPAEKDHVKERLLREYPVGTHVGDQVRLHSAAVEVGFTMACKLGYLDPQDGGTS
ncbi:MAG TPA: hypothetical protein VGN72_03545 [Tepidisphaeraceae bacterium]|nr:hypothetical protein [Tepidisphaeraceae bacterium]